MKFWPDMGILVSTTSSTIHSFSNVKPQVVILPFKILSVSVYTFMLSRGFQFD